MIGTLTMTLWLLVLLWLTLMMFRYIKVGNYRRKLIDSIHQLNLQDLEKDHTYNAVRYKQLYEISYERMFWSFWRPIDSFYDQSLDWVKNARKGE